MRDWQDHIRPYFDSGEIDQVVQYCGMHGDVRWAFHQCGMKMDWAEKVTAYDGDDPEFLELKDALASAEIAGVPNREKYAKEAFIGKMQERASVVCSVGVQPWFRRVWFEKERKTDQEFDAAWEDAVVKMQDRLVGAAWERGVEGLEKPVLFQGQYCYHNGERITEKEFDSKLLTMLLQKEKPEYRSHVNVDQTTRNVAPGVSLEAARAALANMSDEDHEFIHRLGLEMEKAEAEADGEDEE